MEKIILAAIGIAAVWYVVRLLWKEAKGDIQCSCSSDCADKGCCGSRKKQ